MQDLDALKSEIIGRIDSADTLDSLDALRVSELGKKGRVSLMMRELGGMDPDARKAAGQALPGAVEQRFGAEAAERRRARAPRERDNNMLKTQTWTLTFSQIITSPARSGQQIAVKESQNAGFEPAIRDCRPDLPTYLATRADVLRASVNVIIILHLYYNMV